MLEKGDMAQPTRRNMILTLGAVAAALTARAASGQQSRTASPQPMPSPNAPADENVPAGLDGASIPWRNGRRAILPATLVEIRSDAAKLLSMASDFKERVDHTNLSETLPLPLIKEVHQIEKLAKRIQARMKS